MILQTLTRYYDRMSNLPPLGYALHPIHACLVLDGDRGPQLEDIRSTDDSGKVVPVILPVPDYGEKRTVNDRPYFTWDKTDFLLGSSQIDKPTTRDQRRFARFRDLHLEYRDQIDDPAFSAFCSFLESWCPSRCCSLQNWDELVGRNVVVRSCSQLKYLHESQAVQQSWLRHLASKEATHGMCMVTGATDGIARLHPAIKNIHDPGGQSEKGIVVINKGKTAFESYGKTQSYNAPVSTEAAFKYATALNSLLAERHRRVIIGDTTVVYWTEKPSKAEAFFGPMIDSQLAEDDGTKEAVKGFLHRLRQGKAPAEELGEPSTPFYILGLAPNAARISVRFWLVSTIEELCERLMQHVRDLEVVGFDADAPIPVVRELLLETAREAKDISPLLGGAVMRSILTGGTYPESLYSAVIRRIRAERRVTTRRAAILKACLLRQFRQQRITKDVPMSLNASQPDPAYQMGRLFASLEKTQEDAAYPSKLNRTIRDGYFSSASHTPGVVFPRLIRLHQHHIEKLDGGRRVNRERLIQEICSRIACFPSHLPLQEQGMFQIGYYHQRQDFFARPNVLNTDSQENAS